MNIAVLRANALGDFVFVLPALQALRSHYPQAKITYLGLPWHHEFLPHFRTLIDQVVVVSSTTPPPFTHLPSANYNLAFQLHGGGKFANPYLRSLNAHQTIGLQDIDALPLDISVPYLYYQSEYLRSLEVVNQVGVKPTQFLPRLDVIPVNMPPLPHPYIVIHPGANDLRRRWPIDRFSQVSEWCLAQGFNVVITGSKSEQDLVKGISNYSLNLCGLLTLTQLVYLISQAQLVISNDTGPFHLAVAINTPAVGIFWCGNVINTAPLFRTRHRVVISWQTHCPLCGADVATPGYPFHHEPTPCQHLVSFVDSVTIAAVISEISSIRNLFAGF